jgi:hypothetical protein
MLRNGSALRPTDGSCAKQTPLSAACQAQGCSQRDTAKNLIQTALYEVFPWVIEKHIDHPMRDFGQPTATIVTMQPGEETGWRRHDAPLFA